MATIRHCIQEGRLQFLFPNGSQASQYDTWTHYRKRFNNAFGGTKAVDIVFADGKIGWLIEIKDYREHPRTKALALPDEVACKVRDTLAGLVSAQCYAENGDEKTLARSLLRCSHLRVVLHLEQPVSQSRLRPRGGINSLDIQQKLRALLRAIDAHVRVTNRHNQDPEMCWQVTG